MDAAAARRTAARVGAAAAMAATTTRRADGEPLLPRPRSRTPAGSPADASAAHVTAIGDAGGFGAPRRGGRAPRERAVAARSAPPSSSSAARTGRPMRTSSRKTAAAGGGAAPRLACGPRRASKCGGVALRRRTRHRAHRRRDQRADAELAGHRPPPGALDDARARAGARSGRREDAPRKPRAGRWRARRRRRRRGFGGAAAARPHDAERTSRTLPGTARLFGRTLALAGNARRTGRPFRRCVSAEAAGNRRRARHRRARRERAWGCARPPFCHDGRGLRALARGPRARAPRRGTPATTATSAGQRAWARAAAATAAPDGARWPRRPGAHANATVGRPRRRRRGLRLLDALSELQRGG